MSIHIRSSTGGNTATGGGGRGRDGKRFTGHMGSGRSIADPALGRSGALGVRVWMGTVFRGVVGKTPDMEEMYSSCEDEMRGRGVRL